MKKILFILLILNFEKIFSFEPSSSSVFAKASPHTSSSSSLSSFFKYVYNKFYCKFSSSNSLPSSSSNSSEMDSYENYKKDFELERKYLLMKITKDPLSIINEYLPCITREEWNENGKKLIGAAKTDNIKEIKKLLESGGVDVNAKDKNGITALIWASDLGIAKLLLEYKANINLQDDEGNTALIKASLWGNLKLVKLLLENKADINVRDKYGLTALRVAFCYNEIFNLLKEYGATE